MYHLFLFLFMRAVIHALRCSSPFPSRCTHSCGVFVHALHSFMHCIHSYAVFIDSLHSCMRYIHSCVALIHYASNSFTRLFMRCILSFYVAITPHMHAFMRCLLACFYSHSCITYTASCLLTRFLSLSYIVSNIQHLIERYEQISYDTQLPHGCSLFGLVHIAGMHIFINLYFSL